MPWRSLKYFPGNGAGGNAPDCLPGTRAAAALPVADAILGKICVVRMRRPEFRRHFRIRIRARVLVPDQAY